jgi:hypothetical protein
MSKKRWSTQRKRFQKERKLDLSTLSPKKWQLLEDFYNALRFAEDSIINEQDEKFYSNDAWLEEECTVQRPSVKLDRSGISTDLIYNGVCCTDFEKYPP